MCSSDLMKLTEIGGKPTPKQMNRVMESRFGFAVDYDNLTFKKAYKMAKAKDLEGLKGLNDELYEACQSCHEHYRPGYRRRL